MNHEISNDESAVLKKDYTITFVTPMVMHGADPKETAEFRIPSFKGILRYWWRTLQLEPDHNKLLELEERLFGGTTTSQKRKSPISFLLAEPIQGNASVNVLPHKTSKFKPKSIEANKHVTLKAQTLRKDKALYPLYDTHMHYVFHLAGMGQRARRGFGSCQWTQHKWEDVKQFADSLKEVITNLNVQQQFRFTGDNSFLLERISPIQTSHPLLRAVWIGAGKKTSHEVLVNIGEASHKGNPVGRLGSANRRWASPLCCTVRKIGDLYYPIVSEMGTIETAKKDEAYESDRSTFLKEVGVKA